MKQEIVLVNQVVLNEANPRMITDKDFRKLVNSILVLPKMLELRPVVVDQTMVALGGNMRTKALQYLAGLTENELCNELGNCNGYKKKTQEEQDALKAYWLSWHDKPVCHIVKADQLTDQEKQEFIIKDNGSFGKWDFEMLEETWDAQELEEWGVDGALKDYNETWDDLDFAGGNESEPNVNKDVKLTVVIPFAMKDNEDEVRNVVVNALKDYSYCEVK